MFTIYNASAGSGKTYTLAVQYITRLLASSLEGKGAYSQILAVTFTNKATAEMKDRILQQLYGISVGLKSSDNYLESVQKSLAAIGIAMDEDEIRRRAKDVLHDILHDYSRFRVETIDSFFRSVLTDMARELGLPAGLRADIDKRKAISEAVDRIIDQLDEHDDLRRWITQFVHEQMSEGERWDVARKIKDFADHLFDQPYLENQERLTEFLSDDEAVAGLRETLDETRAAIIAGVDEVIANLEDVTPDKKMSADGTLVGDYTRFNGRKYIEGHVEKLRKVKDGGEFPDISATLRIWAEDGAKMMNKTADPADKPLAVEIGRQLAEMFRFEDYAVSILNSINLTRQNINPMRLLNTVGQKVNEVTQERGAFLLDNTPVLLNRMMQGDDASFIYERMGTLLRHIMLDEFQDTSALQWDNFQTLLEENMAKRGSTLIVGDVKQSIYRWRGGDCTILANLMSTMAKYKPVPKNLDKNFRSWRRIINFNNALYKGITAQVDAMCGNDEKWSIGPVYATSWQQVKDGRRDAGCVQLTHFRTDATDKETQDVALREMCDKIRTLLDDGCDARDIAILIRRSDEMQLVAKAFAEYLPGVQLVSDDVFHLDQSAAVNIVVNALRVILHPDDRASLGRLVYLYNVKVLDEKASVNDLYDNIDKCCTFTSAVKMLPAGFADLTTLRTMPLFDLIMRLCDMFRVCDIPGQSPYLMSFLDCVSSSMRDTCGNITTLLNYWDESLYRRSIPGGDVVGVSIMTIHKAKGLEWKTVMIPFCDWTIHDQYHSGSIFWSHPENDGMLCGLPCVAVPLKSDAGTSIFKDDYTRELQNQRIDNLNLLYVATTRACRNLFVWGRGKDPKKPTGAPNRTMMQMIMALRDSLPAGEWSEDADVVRYNYSSDITDDDSKEKDHNRLDVEYTSHTVDYMAHPPLMSFRQSNESWQWTGMVDEEAPTPQQAKCISRGAVLHAIFAAIRTIGDVDEAIESLPIELRTAIDGRDMSNMARQLLQKGCDKNECVRMWFSDHYRLHNECTIAAADPETGHVREHRPDRVMSDDRSIVVVDFKFGHENDEYIDQVKRYMALLQEMYPDKQVDGYLWYVYKNIIRRV